MKSLFEYTLISKDSLKKMIHMSNDSFYGYGIASIFLRQDGSCCIKISNKDIKGYIQFYGHNGRIIGYRTLVVYSPEITYGIAVIFNDMIVPENYIHLLSNAILDTL